MPQTDLSLDELRRYRSSVVAPPDLADFWAAALAEAPASEPVYTPVDSGLVAVSTYDVEFRGFGGHPIRAWLHLPAAPLRGPGPLRGVVQFQGYNGGRGLA